MLRQMTMEIKEFEMADLFKKENFNDKINEDNEQNEIASVSDKYIDD